MDKFFSGMLMRLFQLPKTIEIRPSIDYIIDHRLIILYNQFWFLKMFIQTVRTISNVGQNVWSFDISSWDIAWTLIIPYFSNRSLNQWTRLIFNSLTIIKIHVYQFHRKFLFQLKEKKLSKSVLNVLHQLTDFNFAPVERS